MADAQTRHGRGLLVVIALGALFFALLAMIVLRSGKGETPGDLPSETLTVLPQRLRIRTEPNARAPIVAHASARDKVTMLEDRGAWVRVKTEDGLVGWAERSALERTAERERRIARQTAIKRLPPLEGEVSGNTQLYSGPGIFYPIVGELESGGKVQVYTRDHDFYAIGHGTSIAYAEVDAIDVSSAGTLLEVGSGSDDELPSEVAEQTDTSLPELDEPPPLEPEPEPEPEPEMAAAEPPGGVYSSVPSGGTQPVELNRSVPRYPNAARRAGIEGSVVIRGIVRRDGQIDNVEIIKDLPHNLGEEARRAVSRWRFRPATYRGEPIDVYYTVTVNFRLR